MAVGTLIRLMLMVFALAAGAPGVSACEDPPGLSLPMVTLGMPEGPMYVGSYTRVPVHIAPGLDLGIDDLAFRVMEGPRGGVVSMSRDATFNPKNPDIMLIAGWAPGTYRLDVVARLSGHLITSAPFRVSVVPADRHSGPASVIQAAGRLQELGSAWGGGPAGLQNVGIKAAGPEWRIAVLFVDTTDQQFGDAAAMSAIETTWKENIVEGVSSDDNHPSVAKFYEECSGGSMDVSMTPFGPFHLADDEDADILLDWESVGPATRDTPVAQAKVDFRTHVQAAITAAVVDGVEFADSAGNLKFDSILVVSCSVDPTDPQLFAWPMSTIGAWSSWVTGLSTMTIAATQMPSDWGNIPLSQPRTIFQTESHELGHNLGLTDQYFVPHITCCETDGYELMDVEFDLPNFTIAHRLALGWLDETWVRGFNFASSLAPVDETVVLSPISANAPAAGTFAGIEFRIADGWNDYSELRSRLAGQIADLQLMPLQCVVNTDVAFNPVPALAPPSRPEILLVNDGTTTNAGQLLVAVNDAYTVTDTTTPGYPADFKIKLTAIDPTQATVHVTYGTNLVPDPSITPWGAPPWQSPDVEVRNARNAVDDEWFNVPWEGHPNTVVASVKNGGTLDAPGVQASFFVKDYNVGGSPETLLGTDTHDVARGDTVEFKADWLPPVAGHKCIIVRIAPYTRPAVPPGSPAVPEVTSANNEAQSNYNHFISATASPAERQITQIAVGNPYDQATRVYLSLEQTNPLYRTYLEHTWLDLGPHETRAVTAMFEYAGEPPAPLLATTSIGSYARKPNDVGIRSFIVDPADPTGHHMLPLGGAGASVATGLATKFATFELQGGTAQGQVTTSAGVPVIGGFVILTYTAGKGAAARLTTQTVPVHDRGMFSSQQPVPSGEVEAYFVAPDGFGDATASATDSDAQTPDAK